MIPFSRNPEGMRSAGKTTTTSPRPPMNRNIKASAIAVATALLAVATAQAQEHPPEPLQAQIHPTQPAGDPFAGGPVTRRLAAKKERVAHLGAVVSPAPAAMRDQLKLPRGVGLVVEAIEPKSAA